MHIPQCYCVRKFEYIKRVIRCHKSKDRQYNDKPKKHKSTNNDIQNITQKR